MRSLLFASAVIAAAIAVPQDTRHLTPAPNGPAATADGQQDGIPKTRAADSYAIYSLLLPGQPFTSMPANDSTRWAIARETISFQQMNPRIEPQGELQPPPGEEKPFQEAVEDFKLHQNEHYTLQPKFHIDHAYELLSDTQVNELRAAKSAPDPGSTAQGQYANYPGVTFFSPVFFDSKQQAALVFMNNWCASLCSQGEWIYLEKHGNQWQRMSGITRPGASNTATATKEIRA